MNNKLLPVFILLFVISCNQTQKKETVIQLSQTVDFIDPPLKNADVPFKEFKIDAAKGDTVFYKTGSILVFPSNAFIDKEGKLISGNVKVTYREFTNPIDLYLSGIPMNYDSAGKKYNFESAGMCEMHAYKDGTPVYVNPKSKPQINLASNTNARPYNLYYLDTDEKKWIDKGASVATNIYDPTKIKIVKAGKETDDLIQPVMPEKANNKSPVIQLIIDPASFKELLVYNNLKFQVDANEKNVNTNDTAEEWNNVELEKGNGNGLYTLKFSNDKRTVFYAARPVLEGKDYDKALKIFEKNNEEYKKKLSERITKENIRKEKYQAAFLKDSLDNIQFSAEKERIEKLNILIEKRNKEIAKENIEILKDNKIIEKQNALNEKRKKEIEKMERERASIDSIQQAKFALQQEIFRQKQEELSREEYRFDTVIRGFEIDGFGVWNCDRVINSYPIFIAAIFKNAKGDTLALTNITVVYTSLNALFRFYSSTQIEVNANADNMILGTYNGRLAYISYPDYRKLNITPNTKAQTFIMTVVPEEENNYDYIKTLLK